MQARLRLVERDERRQAVGEECSGECKEPDRSIRKLARFEDPIRVLGKDHSERREFPRFGDDEASARERTLDSPIKIGRVLPNVGEGREDGRKVRSVRGQCR